MKYISILVFLVFLLSFFSVRIKAEEPYSQRMANSQMVRSATLTSWDYPNGLFVESVLKVYDLYKIDKYLTYATQHANATINASTGKIGSAFKFTDYNLDFINPGMFLFELNRLVPKSQYKVALDTLRKQLQQQPRILNTNDGGFWHKKVYPHQMWLDGLFMGTRFYAAYEKEYNSAKGYSDIVNQFILIHSKTYDPEFQLNYHAWSAMPADVNSFWANKTGSFTGCSKEFWGRGLGWYAAALVDVIEILPQTFDRRKELTDIFSQVASGIKRWQDPSSGCWYQLLRYDSSFKSAKGRYNYLEASASSMFTYALFKAVRIGILDSTVYHPVARKAYKGLISNFITSDSKGNLSLNKICRSAGLGPASNPSRDGSASYYLDGSDAGSIVSNDLKGVGPFIMASVEYERAHSINMGSHRLLNNKGKFSISCDKSFVSVNSSVPIQSIQVYNLSGLKISSFDGQKTNNVKFQLNVPEGIYIFVLNKQYFTKQLIR
jgi:unsaturated rhamnogalacturonyl hydrolase